MLFNVEVLPQDEYEAWAAEQEQQASEEAGAEGLVEDSADSAEGSGAEGTGAEGSGAEATEENDE